MAVERKQMIELVQKDGTSILLLDDDSGERPRYFVLPELIQKDPPKNKFRKFKLEKHRGVYHEVDM